MSPENTAALGVGLIVGGIAAVVLTIAIAAICAAILGDGKGKARD